ncbi:ABC transporter ATP-binding protein [Kutzneria buriramensis]|uniref:ABC transporter ATP-binding protein n=1 Tax=Kutzneria buriramensis TaxID=1045776 RepID=UPI000E26940F|nr:ABC transporter ATP-binding protein [Kutzneria buriramensis]
MRDAIALESVTVTFGGGYTAVADITFAVPAGSFVSVVGPTGCGKSTVLNCVAGLCAPTTGQVLVADRPLRGLNRAAGYLFQQDTLLPWKSVQDNIALGLQINGVGQKERARLSTEWAARVGLEGFTNSYPHELSGGMRKRTALAQVWITEPDILLMDEPFGALDVQTRQIMHSELLRLWTGSGKTVLFVTHDLDEAVTLSDEVIVLSAGPASHVLGRYPVGLPRPRDPIDTRMSTEYGEIYQSIWSALRAEVLRGYA